MKQLLIFSFLLFQGFVASAVPTLTLECYSDRRIHSTPSESSAVLCSNVNSKAEIELVIKCYLDERLKYTESLVSALLCSSVKSNADKDRAILCLSNSPESIWASVLSCK